MGEVSQVESKIITGIEWPAANGTMVWRKCTPGWQLATQVRWRRSSKAWDFRTRRALNKTAQASDCVGGMGARSISYSFLVNFLPELLPCC